jgi:hypothetical protein
MHHAGKFLALLIALGGPGVHAQTQPRKDPVRIDLDHILKGTINRSGQIVGVHHQPSAPKQMKFNGVWCDLEFYFTSKGGREDVRTARVRLRDPKSKQVVAEKFSTLYPSAWARGDIEKAIREAYADALARGGVEKEGRWGGKTRAGVRIEGYLTRDRKAIATAFPVLVRPRN